MKKSLVLAMAMALGVTASAYAANPFSDVPAGHWAYDSVSKLAAAGVIDGYGDGTYGGDKLMTRYEMAQIVARAMANGANVDKLAAEFADELDALGVRVAALEKKSDNVKIAGQIRYNYARVSGNSKASYSNLRTRLTIRGKINDDWTYTGLLQNVQKFRNDVGDEGTDFQRAFVTGKLGGLAVTAGRYAFTDITASNFGGNIYDHRFDGIQVSYGKEINVTVGGGKASGTNVSSATPAATDTYFATVTAKIGKIGDIHGGWYKFDDFYGYDASQLKDNEIWTIGTNLNIAKDLRFDFNYIKSDVDYNGEDDGYVVGLGYKGAKSSVPGTWGVYANYFDQAQGTVVAHGMDGQYTTDYDYSANEGFKGYAIGANYTFAKNIVGTLAWYDFETKGKDEKDIRTMWSQLMFTF